MSYVIPIMSSASSSVDIFFNEYRKRQFLANMIVDDEAEFSLNDEINSRNARQCVPVGEPPNFYYQRPDLCQKLTV